jgi:hypothetical protein
VAAGNGNGHNGKVNGHALGAALHLVRNPDDRAAFDTACEALAADIATPPLRRGIVNCDTCGELTQWALDNQGRQSNHYKVHFPQTAVRGADGKVVPPCPRSWPPQAKATKSP